MTEAVAPTVLLLHEGGWDEVVMVAAGLFAAYLVIVWTGRSTKDADDEDEFEDEEVRSDSAEPPDPPPPEPRRPERPPGSR